MLTEVRARRQKGQGQQRRLGAKLHFTSLQSTQGSSASKHQKMGVCAAQVLTVTSSSSGAKAVAVEAAAGTHWCIIERVIYYVTWHGAGKEPPAGTVSCNMVQSLHVHTE